MDRRTFLKGMAGAGVAGAALAVGCDHPNTVKAEGYAAGEVPLGQMTYRSDKHGQQVSLLGFGMMRLPAEGGGTGSNRDKNDAPLDQEMINRMVDYAIEHGVNYFDTAPVYCKGRSETATGIALNRHPRDKWLVATKLSNFRTWTREASLKMYEESFEKLGVDYIDYYLLHSFGGVDADGKSNFEMRFVDNGMLDFLMEEREKGRIRNLGWSFHGLQSEFDKVVALTDKYHWDFAQIQMNYLDWRHASLNKSGWRRDADAEYLYDKLEKTGVQAVIMEPLRGGSLGRMNDDLTARLKAMRPDDSPASWAFRWVASHPNILTTLSGINQMEHMEENIRTFSPLEPCTEAENVLLAEIADVMAGFPTIPCTTCSYCMPCPFGVDIPGNFAYYNDAVDQKILPLPDKSKWANQCTDCEACLPKCPQQIRIPNQMARIVETLSRR